MKQCQCGNDAVQTVHGECFCACCLYDLPDIRKWSAKTVREYRKIMRGPSTAQTNLFDEQINLFE
jgi:hypothetical protein